MNKIFKVIFNKSLGRMVIVSEHAKGHRKTKSTQNKKNQSIASNIKVVKPLIVISSLFLSPYVFAGAIINNGNTQCISASIAYIPDGNGGWIQPAHSWGMTAASTSSDSAIVIGNQCHYITWALGNGVAIGGGAANDHSIAMGNLSRSAPYAIALGESSTAFWTGNIAIGNQAKADGKNSIALGANSFTDRDNSFAVGSATNLRQITSVAAGTENTDAVNKLQMDDSFSVVNSRVTSEVGTLNTRISTEVGTLNTRIGTEVGTLDTRITSELGVLDGKIQTNSTAILGLDGRVSTNETDIANLQQGQGTLNQLAVQYDSATQDIISLKGVNGTKITNLQDATLDANSTDAVTGRQLNTTNQTISTLDGRVTSEVGTLDTRITSEVGTLDGKITTNSTAISGLDGRVSTNETDIANLQQGQGTLNQLAVQYDSLTQDTISLKGVNGTKITNLQDATLDANSTDAVTGRQLSTTNQTINTLDSRVTSEVGILDTRITTEVGALDGKITTNSNAISALDGRVTTEVGTLDTRITSEVGALDGKITTNSTAILGLDGRVSTNETDIANLQQGQGTLNQLAVQYDSASQDTISLKGVNGTKITNLQAGDTSSASSTDAVTGGQLFTTNQNLENLDTRVTTEVTGLNTRIGNEVMNLDGKIQTNSTAISGLDGRVTVNESDISNLKLGQTQLGQLAVQYDSASQDVVTLKGVNGTKITNLQAGDISSASSTDAVTGGQLFNTNTALNFLSGQFDSAMQQATSVLGGGSSYNNGVFVLPSYSIQGKNYRNVGDTFGAVNNEISALKTSVSDLRNYVDQQDQGILGSANGYTDSQSTDTLSNAKAYIDQQDAQNLANANAYTDQQANQTLTAANGYTDQKAAATLADANAYTDDRVAAAGQYININGAGGVSGGGSSSTGLNSTAIGPNTVVTGNNSTAVGVGNHVSGHNSGAFGDPNVVTGNDSYVVGNDNNVSADNTFVLGNNVKAIAKNSVALGNNSTLTRDNTVSVGSTDNERQITYVADATEATDAVNLRQMQSANSETLSASKSYTDTQISHLESSFNDFSYQTDRRFKEVDKQFDRQGAMSAAMMNMATSTSGLKGRNRVGVGAGFQGSEKAVAVGYQRMINENTSLSLGGAFTDDESSGGAGVGFSW